MTYLSKFISCILIAYFLVVCTVYIFQDKLIFPGAAVDRNLNRQIEDIKPGSKLQIAMKDGSTVHGWFVKTRIKSPLVLVFGGQGTNVATLVLDSEKFPEYNFATFNYRGYGQSTGLPTEHQLINDASEILDKLIQQKSVDPKQIYVIGLALGSSIAVNLAARRDIHKLILSSPFSNLPDVAKDTYPFLPTHTLIKHKFDLTNAVKKIRSDTLILYTDKDQIVQPQRSLDLYNLFKQQVSLTKIEGITHNTMLESADFWLTIRSFMKQPDTNKKSLSFGTN